VRKSVAPKYHVKRRPRAHRLAEVRVRHSRSSIDNARFGLRGHVVWDHAAVQSADSSEVVQLPIACTLGPYDSAARTQRWKAILAKGRLSARRSGHLVEVRYVPDPERPPRELQGFTAAEQECCSFVDWNVTQEEDHVVLHIRADPARADDIAVFAVLFRADDLERPSQ
jgi:hypothetical protein